MTNLQVWFMLKPKLNFWDLSDRVCFVIKTREDNDVTDCIGVFYTQSDTKLS